MKRLCWVWIVFLLVVSLSGCATQGMYYWGDYSNTLYHSKKHPSEQTGRDHMQALEKIVEQSQKENLRIPPGVYAELGYIYLRQNKMEQAIAQFTMEKLLYPESALLMERLEKAARLADKPTPGDSDSKGAPSPEVIEQGTK